MEEEKISSSKIHWEKWTAVGTVIMALCALVTSVWQGYTLQQHNKLSLRPYLEFEANIDRRPDGKIAFGLFINNNGLGPAEVTDVVYQVAQQQPASTFEIWQALGVNTAANCFGSGNVARFYKVGDRQMVIRATDRECALTEAEYDLMKKSFRIKIRYKSLYGEEFTARWNYQ